MPEHPLERPKVHLQSFRDSPSKLRGVSSFRALHRVAVSRRLQRRPFGQGVSIPPGTCLRFR
eukprot:9602025-Alexandrium_andersonii.AAC.1